MLPLLAVGAIAAFAAAMALTLFFSLAPIATVHLAFAVGVMPLILGAMLHFVPVLTRSGSPPAWLRAVPLLALAAGTLIVASFVLPALYPVGMVAAPPLALLAAIPMVGWILGRARHTLGVPHPGLDWYLAAVVCLVLALLAVGAIPLLPAQRGALRLFHLHLNTLGFVGLTAIGTLQVLLPTAAGRPDKQAAARLRQDLHFAFGGVLLIAGGAAWAKPVAYVGLALLLVPVVRLGTAWAIHYWSEIGRRDGAAASLALALMGLAGMLFLGVGHAKAYLRGFDAILGFIVAFLLPLVTGAVSQLLPVWLRPGPQAPWHADARRILGTLGGVRGAIFVCGGMAVALGWRGGIWLAAAGLAVFLPPLLKVLARRA